MTSQAPLAGQTRTSAFLQARQITEAGEFQFRRNRVDKAHVRTLAQALRNAGRLDPILVWREVDPDGEPSGRLMLLDGAHRLAAYRATRGEPSERNRGVPAVVVTCDRGVARRLALLANSKDTLALTPQEKADGAWSLVREPGGSHSISQIAKASTISQRTVSSMRLRWKALQEAGKEATGEWWRDRQDALADGQGDELTDEARRAEVIKIGNAIREAAGTWPNRDGDLVAEALSVAFGRKLRGMIEFLYGAGENDFDEFAESPISTRTGTLSDDTDGAF